MYTTVLIKPGTYSKLPKKMHHVMNREHYKNVQKKKNKSVKF